MAEPASPQSLSLSLSLSNYLEEEEREEMGSGEVMQQHLT